LECHAKQKEGHLQIEIISGTLGDRYRKWQEVKKWHSNGTRVVTINCNVTDFKISDAITMLVLTILNLPAKWHTQFHIKSMSNKQNCFN